MAVAGFFRWVRSSFFLSISSFPSRFEFDRMGFPRHDLSSQAPGVKKQDPDGFFIFCFLEEMDVIVDEMDGPSFDGVWSPHPVSPKGKVEAGGGRVRYFVVCTQGPQAHP